MANNIIGLDLNIDQNYLADAVKQTVLMGISESLNGKNEIVSQIVNSVLSTKVAKNGRISNYESDNNYTLLEFYVNQQLDEVVRAELKNMVEEKRPEIAAMIRKQLSQKKVADNFANKFLSTVAGALSSDYKTNVTVEIEKEKERY